MSWRKNNFYSVNFILFIVCSTYISKCTAPLNKLHDLPYSLKKPSEKYFLQRKLKEVSGLSLVSDKEAALIEDENGSLFFYNFEKKTISKTIPFAKDGDYEDLNIRGDTAYILESNGVLFEVKNFKGTPSDILVNKYKTG
ncbi:MAG: hypothetical protein ABI855_01790, partial [Bacteroidota bacterium]